MLRAGLLLRPRRQRPGLRRGPVPAVDHPQAVTWRDQFGSRAAWAAAGASPGARSASTSPRRSPPWPSGRGPAAGGAAVSDEEARPGRLRGAALPRRRAALGHRGRGPTRRLLGGPPLFAEGEPANGCWLIRAGGCALRTEMPGRGAVVLQTLGPGDVLGVSWLVPPHRWQFEAVTTERVDARELEPTALRERLAAEPALGYAVTLALYRSLLTRLQATRRASSTCTGAPVTTEAAAVPRTDAARALRVTDRERETADTVTLRLAPAAPGRMPAVPAGPVHDALRARGRRDRDLGQRRPTSTTGRSRRRSATSARSAARCTTPSRARRRRPRPVRPAGTLRTRWA